ncbi:MAG TPA: CHASE domain-containing protein, partial [Pyrinomonadaceae bacterium]|nr:CHASE domain-containing protein [Pyrinomonadaceae bacterium]
MATLKEKFRMARSSEVVKLPYLVLATLILLTIGTTYLFYQSARGKDSARFSSEVQRIQTALETRLGLYVALLKSGRGLIESNPNLTRRDFAQFVNNLELSKHYAGVQGIGYTKLVKPEGREALIQKMRAEGFPNFKMFPDAETDFRTAIIYLEPLDERNRQAVGFDMASEANRREAMERARDTGAAAASARVTLLQEVDQNVQHGFLIYLPVYSTGLAPSTLEERRGNLDGFVYSPFRAGNFLSEIQLITNTGHIEVKIYDGEFDSQNLLAQTQTPEDEAAAPPINEDFSAISKLDIGGRNWIIVYETNPAFHQQSSIGWTPIIFLCGMAFSFLLFGMTYWESSARARIQAIASELLDSEQQKRKLLVKEQEARMAAESANLAKDEFISVVSHELRTPLNAIAGWTTILKTNHLSEEKQEFALGKIEKNLRLQADLVDDLL